MSEKEVAFHDRGLVTHKSLTLFPIANFTGLFLHSGNIALDKGITWKQDKTFGGGVLRDLGSHIIDLLYYLMGEFDQVFCRLQNISPDRIYKNSAVIFTYVGRKSASDSALNDSLGYERAVLMIYVNHYLID